MNWAVFLILVGLAAMVFFCRGMWRPVVILVASSLGGVVALFAGNGQAGLFVIPAAASVFWVLLEYAYQGITYNKAKKTR